MNKRLICTICAVLIFLGAFGLTVAADENSGGADKIHTLFDMRDGFIVENPIDTRAETGKPWLLVGKDVFMTDNGGYPAAFENPYDKSSFYYLAGSNSIEWLISDKNYTDYLSNDFIIEYVLNYDETSSGAASMTIAYNYDYYIEVCVLPSGCGDIAIVTPLGSVSALDSESILNADNGEKLISALSGDVNVLPERLAISIKVSLDENKMPEEIEIYINGLLVGKTNGGFAESVENLTPSTLEGGIFPKDKLGNIVALKVSPAACGEINNIYIYTVGENAEPNADSQAYYAEAYGNASYVIEPEGSLSAKPETELPADHDESEDEYIDSDIIINIVLVVVALSAVISLIILVILILRKKQR